MSAYQLNTAVSDRDEVAFDLYLEQDLLDVGDDRHGAYVAEVIKGCTEEDWLDEESPVWIETTFRGHGADEYEIGEISF